MKRNLYDDFLNQLKPSTNDKYQGINIIQGKILGEGLVDKAYTISNARVPMTRVNMFKLWYRQRNFRSLFLSAWQYDLGKLMVPNFFMHVDLLRAVADKYVHFSRVIRENYGEVLLTIRREEFQEFFDLYEPFVSMIQVNLEEIKVEYHRTKGFVTSNLLPPNLEKEEKTSYHIGPSSVEPFPIGSFAKYLQATFFSLS